MLPNSSERRALVAVLRCLGVLDLLALAAVLAPRPFLESAAQAVGLPLPEGPLPVYLVRSASILYAVHGVLVLFLSLDVVRYRPVIRFLALVALVHGVVILGIDLFERMPLWWCVAEGPGIAAMGIVVLLLLRRAGLSAPEK